MWSVILCERRISSFSTENTFSYSVYFFDRDSAVLALYMYTVKEGFTVSAQSMMYTVGASLIFSAKSTEDWFSILCSLMLKCYVFILQSIWTFSVIKVESSKSRADSVLFKE